MKQVAVFTQAILFLLLVGQPLHLVLAETPTSANSKQAETNSKTKRSKPLSSKNALVTLVQKGSSSKGSKAQSIAELPLKKMNPKQRKEVENILGSLGLYRRMPTLEFEMDAEAYRFFTNHPDVACSIWRAMDISKFKMWQTGRDNYEADAGDGTVGIIDVLYRSPKQNIILCEGKYKTPFLPKPIITRAILHLQTEFDKSESGKDLITHKVDLFVAFPSQTVETAAKAISPLSNFIVDKNFREVSVFLYMMSLAMTKQPGWVEYIAGRLEGVLESRKTQLVEITAKVYVAEKKRELANNGKTTKVSLEQVLNPLTKTALSENRSPDKTNVQK